MEIKDILKKAAGDVLTEDTLNAIDTAFSDAVKEKAQEKVETQVTERLQLEVESALTRLDEEHTEKLQNLLEAVDNDHVKKLKAVVHRLDENHCDKLKFLVKRHKTQLQTEASKLRDSLVNEISDYLDLYLDKVIPIDQVNEAVNNTEARRILDSVKKAIAVDSSFITESVRSALIDGKQKIDNLKKDLNNTLEENIELNSRAKKAEAGLILEQKTKELPSNKKEYVCKVFADKDPEYITENFNYVVEMFERDEQDQVEVLSEGAKKSALTHNIDAPVTESNQSGNDADTPVTDYLSELKRHDH